MRIIYEAIDGNQFTTRDSCENYEAELVHPFYGEIIFYNKSGGSFRARHHAFFDPDIYQVCEKIEIHNKKEVDDLRWIAEQTGWCEFKQITEPGIWIRKGNGFGAVWDKEQNYD